jgi:hypothetical protein
MTPEPDLTPDAEFGPEFPAAERLMDDLEGDPETIAKAISYLAYVMVRDAEDPELFAFEMQDIALDAAKYLTFGEDAGDARVRREG